MTPLSPLESSVLQQQLPTLTAAVEEATMHAAFQAALLDAAVPRFTIERCDLKQATLISAIHCNFRYLLHIRDAEQGDTQEVLVSGDLFAGEEARQRAYTTLCAERANAWRTRPELARYSTPVAVIAPLGMAALVFPIDADMPTLLAATDNQHMLRVLREALPAAHDERSILDTCQTELVDYGRQNRCTLRYRLSRRTADGSTSQPVTVYGKLTADGSGSLAGPLSSALRNHGTQTPGPHVRIPQTFAWLPELKLSLLEAIPGEAQVGAALKARLNGSSATGALSLEAMVDQCITIVAFVHTSALHFGPRRTLGDELAQLKQRIAGMQQAAPELSTHLSGWVQRLASYTAGTMPLVLCHGDFTSGQILFDGAHSGLIDFDSICQAEPALDLTQFLTYLQLPGTKVSAASASATRTLMEDLSLRMLDHYSTIVGYGPIEAQQLHERVTVYRVVSLIRRAIQSWHKFKPKRVMQALDLINDTAQMLP